jgi:signal peptidase I
MIKPASRIPALDELKKELKREKRKKEYIKTLFNTIYILLAVAASAVLVAMLCLPVLRVCGTSMEPTLETGEIVLAIKNVRFKSGDIIAFYYNNKILLKRVIGNSGDQIFIDTDGTVYVNGKELNEPYVTEKSLEQCDIDFPYQVPDGKIFVLGDHRLTSMDSRSTAIGCIAEEFIVGKIIMRIWPLDRLGRITN